MNEKSMIAKMITLAEYSEEVSAPEIRRELEENLKHELLSVRQTAAITIGKLRIAELLPALLEASRSPELQETTLHAIRMIDRTEAGVVARRVLQNGPGPARMEAMRTIRENGEKSPEITAALERIMETGSRAEARVAERTLRKL